MIGNDVVDLEVAQSESNWKRKGFLDKVFSAPERKCILESEDPEVMVWLLWSMKEASYKAHQRRFRLPRKLNWQHQECVLHSYTATSALGSVRIGKHPYSIQSEIATSYLHTTATQAGQVFSSLCFRGSSESARKSLLEQINKHYGFPWGLLTITKNKEGIPFLQFGNNLLSIGFSLSSHGRYASFCSSLRKT